MNRLAVLDLLEDAGVECYTREEWGSVRPDAYIKRRSTHPMPSGPADYHFLHITVTPDSDTVLEGKAGARKVESYGLSTPPMVSYQDLVTNEAKYFQGQDYGTKGTHTVNDKNISGYPHDLNKEGYALAIMQNVGDEVTDEQVKVIAMVFAAREIAGFVKKNAPIYPHRAFDWKLCPGDKAMARLDEIRRLKDHYVEHGLPNPAIDARITTLTKRIGQLRKRAAKYPATSKRRRAIRARIVLIRQKIRLLRRRK